MDRSALLSPWRILLGILPLGYAGLLVIELPHTFMWLGGIAALLIALLFLATSLGYPLLACWPAFSSALLLVTCGIMLWQGMPDTGIVPLTRSPLELWGVGVLAGIVLIWVVLSTHRMQENISECCDMEDGQYETPRMAPGEVLLLDQLITSVGTAPPARACQSEWPPFSAASLTLDNKGVLADQRQPHSGELWLGDPFGPFDFGLPTAFSSSATV